MQEYPKITIMEEYIVIERFGGADYAAIVTNEDGSNKIFDTYDDALAEANECQDGLVVEI